MKKKAIAKKLVVIIDDDINQLLLHEKFIGNERYNISKFTGAKEALESLDKNNPPDFIITDLFMPNIDGWRLCRLLRSPEYKAFNNVPLLVVSATFSGDDAAKITADTGANAFLPMPADKKSLISTVEAMLKNDHLTGRQRVLIVEDCKTLAKILKSAFQDNGYEVHTALTGKEAKKKFLKMQFDFAVIDYHLPDENGDVLLSMINAKSQDTVIVMITTDSNPDLSLNFLHKGASAYLRKPFAPEYLVELCAKSGREKSLLRVERLLEEKLKLLRESEQRWQYALEGVEDGLWDWNVQTNEVYFSSHWKEMLGYDGDEIGTGLDEWDSKIHPDDKEETYEKLDRHLKGETPSYRSEHRILCKDGTWKWVLDRGKVIERNADGKPLRIIGTHTDIDVRKQAEAEAAESHKRLITVLNSIEAFIYVADMQTHELLFVNDYGKRIWGNIERRKCWQVIQSGQTGPCAFCTNDKLHDSDGNPSGTHRWEFKNLKNGRWYDCRDSAIRWIDGRIVRLEIATDITDRKKAEEALNAANRKLEALWNIASLEDADFKTVCDHVLETIVRMTGSMYGFYGFLNPDESVMTIHSWSGEAMKGCGIVDKPQEFSITEAGLWAEAVRKRKPMIFNNYSGKNPAKKGCPEGHVQLKNLLVVPFMAHKRIITVAAVANSQGDYTKDDVDQITSFLQGIQAIVEQMETEIALRESQQRMDYLFSQSLDGFFFMMFDEPIVWNESIDKEKTLDYVFQHQRMTKVNQAMLDQYRAKEEDFIGLTPYDLFKHDLAHGRNIWRGLFDKGRWHVETDERRMDGSEMVVLGDYICIYDSEGRITGHFGIQSDITERKKAEEELRKSEEYNRSIIEVIPDIIFRFDRNGKYLDIIASLDYKLYQPREKLLGKLIADVFPKQEMLHFMESIHKALDTESLQVVEYRLEIKSTACWFEARIVPAGKNEVIALVRDITERKQAEETLRESEERFQKMLSLVPDMVSIHDPEMNILYSNWKGFADVDAEKRILNTKCYRTYRGYDNICPDCLAKKVLVSRKNIQKEVELPDGTWVDLRVLPILNEQGDIEFFMEWVRDITERKKAEEALEFERKRFAMLLEVFPGYIHLQSPDYSVRYANKYFIEHFGDPKGRLCHEVLWGRSKPCVDCLTFKVFDTDTPQIWEWLEAPDGRNYMIYDYPFIDSDGSKLVLEIGMDITERKKTEDELRMREKQLSLSNEYFPGLVSILDTDLRFKYASIGFEKLLGIAPEQVIGKTLLEVIGEENFSAAEPHLKEALSGKLVTYESNSKLPSGIVVQGFNVIVPDFDEEGNVTQFFVFGIDITERKQIEEHLKYSHKMQALGTLAGGIAHEFNNILAGMMGSAEIIKDSLSEDNQSHRFAEILLKEGERAVKLIRQIGIFSRSKTPSLEPLKIAEAVQESISFIRSSMPKNIIINENLSYSESLVMASPELIEQILVNLCSNSAYSMQEKGGIIEVELDKVDISGNDYVSYPELESKNYVSLRVSDTGSGFDPSHRERIFEPFFTTKPVGSGTGMGLAVVHSIVEELKGTIRVDTEEGKGTVFEVLLPETEELLSKNAGS